MNTATMPLNWSCKHTWRRSAKNTGWCVLGCSIGDFGTILFFQITEIPFPMMGIMTLAIINGLLTSIALETFILMRQKFTFLNALKTACGMSFISMLAMEIAMNTTDYILTEGAMLTWWVVPIMLTVGFLTPWPYNYYRLKKIQSGVSLGELMLGYAIFNINVTNPEDYKEYLQKVVPITEKFGGKYIVRGGTTTKIEGTFPHPRTVVIQFPSYQKALEWYNSEEYKPIREIRFKNAKSIGMIIEGA